MHGEVLDVEADVAKAGRGQAGSARQWPHNDAVPWPTANADGSIGAGCLELLPSQDINKDTG